MKIWIIGLADHQFWSAFPHGNTWLQMRGSPDLWGRGGSLLFARSLLGPASQPGRLALSESEPAVRRGSGKTELTKKVGSLCPVFSCLASKNGVHVGLQE